MIGYAKKSLLLPYLLTLNSQNKLAKLMTCTNFAFSYIKTQILSVIRHVAPNACANFNILFLL